MNASLSAKKLHCPSIAEFLLDAACLESQVIQDTISVLGDSTLKEYLDHVVRVMNNPFQPRDDVIDAVDKYVAPLLGNLVARRVCSELEKSPVALTTNHHGVDFFAQSVQGSLIFSLRTVDGRPARTVPVFACGGIPLDNLTYPQGLLLYHVGSGKLDSMPRKLPIFSNRQRRQTASLAEPIQRAMIERARKRAAKMVDNREISPSLLATLQRIFDDDYASPAVSRLSTYSEQAVVLNHRIWKHLFANSVDTADLVYVELEKLVATLLESDLLNPNSLVSCAILDSKCREEVVEALDGVIACWKRSKLMERIAGRGGNKVVASKKCGTMFFWGIDDQYRKVPLYLVKGAAGEMLRGVDDKGRQFEHPFQPEALVQGLQERKLLPSLFTCFLALSLARGVTCLGGYYQAGYLPEIQRGLAGALRSCHGYGDVAGCVERVHTTGYLGGMQAMTIQLEPGRMGPAGPVEVIAGGGLTHSDLEQILSCTVREAHVASLFETIPDLGLEHAGPPDWKAELALDCARRLSGKVVFGPASVRPRARREGEFDAKGTREINL